MIIVFKYGVPQGFLAISLFPFIILKTIEFLIRLLYHQNWRNAYQNVTFEREANKNEKDLNYLKSRTLLNYLSYL